MPLPALAVAGAVAAKTAAVAGKVAATTAKVAVKGAAQTAQVAGRAAGQATQTAARATSQTAQAAGRAAGQTARVTGRASQQMARATSRGAQQIRKPAARLPRQRDVIRVFRQNENGKGTTSDPAVVLGRAKINTPDGPRLGLRVAGRDGKVSTVRFDAKNVDMSRGDPIKGRAPDGPQFQQARKGLFQQLADANGFAQRNLPEKGRGQGRGMMNRQPEKGRDASRQKSRAQGRKKESDLKRRAGELLDDMI